MHAVGDEEDGGPRVIGDHPRGGGVRAGRRVRAGETGHGTEQALEQVVVVVAAAALQNRCRALQTHAGVHAGALERRQRTVFGAVELRKHQVPELGVAVPLLVRRPGRPAGHAGAQVVEDLRVRAARPGVAHRPEVALVRHHAGRFDADLVHPNGARLRVVRMHGDPEAFLGQFEDAGDELPRPNDGLFFVVVAETEIAEHLEQRVMAPGVADVLQIVVLAAGAHATLAARRARVGGPFAPGERVLELHHAGVGEQQRRIVRRHKRARRHHAVAAGGEKLQVRGADLVGLHWRRRCFDVGRTASIRVDESA